MTLCQKAELWTAGCPLASRRSCGKQIPNWFCTSTSVPARQEASTVRLFQHGLGQVLKGYCSVLLDLSCPCADECSSSVHRVRMGLQLGEHEQLHGSWILCPTQGRGEVLRVFGAGRACRRIRLARFAAWKAGGTLLVSQTNAGRVVHIRVQLSCRGTITACWGGPRFVEPDY